MKKKLYLANPYGFSKQTQKLLSEFINIFKDLNIEVYEPFERTEHLTEKDGEWAYDMWEKISMIYIDVIAFLQLLMVPPDEGVSWIGNRNCFRKQIFL